MRLRWFVFPVLAASFLIAAVPAFSQVGADYEKESLDLNVGVGGNSWDVDWGHGRMLGETVWVDWYPRRIPSMLRGLGVELEARDISHDRHLPPQANIRQDTAGGGPIFEWHHFRNVRPYAKFIFSHGSYDFTSPSPTYSHDTRSLWAEGLGFDIRVYRPIWARVDYEYQTWQKLLGKTPNPQGFTVGVAYSFAYGYHSKH